MRPTLRLICCLPLVLGACRAPGAAEDPATMPAPVRPLSGLVAQQVIVAPINRLRETDPLGWTQQIPRSRVFMRAFDDALEAELGARGLKSRWVYPAALVQAGRSNPSYSVDPYTLAAAPLLAPGAEAGTRMADPLATQLRTMIALQESARAVLIPVELSFERAPKRAVPAPGDAEQATRGVAVLRLALVDGRISEIRWIGDVRGEPSLTLRDAVSSVVAHTADLIAAP